MINKALLFGVFAVGTTGAGVGSYFLLKNTEVPEKTIEELLDSDTKGKKITKEKKTEQKNIDKWKKYIQENTKNQQINENDIFGMKNWSTAKNTNTAITDDYIDACDKQLKIRVKDNQDQRFKNYVDYCTA